ncbi:MAG: hypothetical protein IPM55_23900 [Acidobacteria bacterium]|nr:hypothetical protein [Acidobacteriota bacterium]
MEPVDERSDIFSLGVIVRSLTGRKPLEGKDYQELMTAVMTQPFHIESDDPAVRRARLPDKNASLNVRKIATPRFLPCNEN